MNKIKIEILFPEFCNLFGDMYNMKYLKMCLPDAEFTETALDETPKFVNEDVNLISVKNFSIFTGTEIAYFKLTKDDVLDTIDSYALFNGMASSQNNMTFYIFGSGSYTLDFFLTNLNKNYATGLFISTSRQFVYETIGGDVVKTSLSKNFQI